MQQNEEKVKEIFLKLKENVKYSLEAEYITPDDFAGKSREEIENIQVYYANIRKKLGEFFEIEGNATNAKPSEIKIIIIGDLSKVKRIGERMTSGTIIIKGNVGMHLGDYMKGGKILVEGNVGSFSFTSMKGGEAIIKGNVGDYLACTYRGDWRGMSGGRILVEGNAGDIVGLFMQDGLIEIKGNAGEFVGNHMKGGTIIVYGTARRVGAQMKGGKIVMLNDIEILPSFKFVGNVSNLTIDKYTFNYTFKKYIGDFAESKDPKGELYVKIDTK